MSREEMLALAERVEAMTGPDREVDLEIALLKNPGSKRRYNPFKRIMFEFELKGGWFDAPYYTASLDAAMRLAGGLDKRTGGVPGLFNEARSRLSKQFRLHTNFWPEDQDYGQWLARYFTAAALRARTEGGDAT